MDVQAKDPVDAYSKLKDVMDEMILNNNNYSNFAWESSDEWFLDDGTQLTEEEVVSSRLKVLDKAQAKCDMCAKFFAKYSCNNPDECDCPKCQGLCLCDDIFTKPDGWDGSRPLG